MNVYRCTWRDHFKFDRIWSGLIHVLHIYVSDGTWCYERNGAASYIAGIFIYARGSCKVNLVVERINIKEISAFRSVIFISIWITYIMNVTRTENYRKLRTTKVFARSMKNYLHFKFVWNNRPTLILSSLRYKVN